MSRTLVALALSPCLALLLGCSDGGASGGGGPDGLEPPANPFLADSPWPMTHRNPYNQASSPLPGPDGSETLVADDSAPGVLPITLNYDAPGADGRRAVWAKDQFNVMRMVEEGGAITAVERLPDPINLDNPISGAYTVLDSDGVLFVPRGAEIRAFGAAVAGDLDSGVVELRSLSFPAGTLEDGDSIVGMNLTYDGHLAMATGFGVVAVVSRDFRILSTVQLAGSDGTREEVSNSIAVDEEGGIYVVTSARMHRVSWTGERLSLDPEDGAWAAPYETGPEVPLPGRLGTGSGSTPSLMGLAGDRDRFVVVTDGQQLMHLVLFWRDEIPDDWEPVAPGVDRRIAAQVPIRFGDPAATDSLSEQSVLVRGHQAMVVSNTYDWPFRGNRLLDLASVLLSGLTAIQPYGVEAFRWDPSTRTLVSAWANASTSCPNGIPTMSAATGLAHCIGARDGEWTLEALDWETGANVFHHRIGGDLAYNSFYAATQIGPDRTVTTGTLGGPLFLRPR